MNIDCLDLKYQRAYDLGVQAGAMNMPQEPPYEMDGLERERWIEGWRHSKAGIRRSGIHHFMRSLSASRTEHIPHLPGSAIIQEEERPNHVAPIFIGLFVGLLILYFWF